MANPTLYLTIIEHIKKFGESVYDSLSFVFPNPEIIQFVMFMTFIFIVFTVSYSTLCFIRMCSRKPCLSQHDVANLFVSVDNVKKTVEQLKKTVDSNTHNDKVLLTNFEEMLMKMISPVMQDYVNLSMKFQDSQNTISFLIQKFYHSRADLHKNVLNKEVTLDTVKTNQNLLVKIDELTAEKKALIDANEKLQQELLCDPNPDSDFVLETTEEDSYDESEQRCQGIKRNGKQCKQRRS